MKKLVTLLLLVIASLIVIPPAFWKDQNNLGDNYYFLPTYESIDVGYPGGNAVIYRSPQKYSFKEIKVEGNIVSVSQNNDFIFAVTQSPSKNEKKSAETLEIFVIHKSLGTVSGPFPVSSSLKSEISNRVPVTD